MDSDEQQREKLRNDHALRSLSKNEEGTGVHNLPSGIYGFTYSPATETPLFARKAYHSFEVHKLASGRTVLLAFATEAEAETIRKGEDGIEVTVYPDPHEQATVLVTIPFERVLSNLYKPIRYDGNALPLKLAAE